MQRLHLQVVFGLRDFFKACISPNHAFACMLAVLYFLNFSLNSHEHYYNFSRKPKLQARV